MDDTFERLKQHISELAARPTFRHHQWFLEYHLKIVERIINELLEYHPEADRQVAMVMGWMHDYGKLLEFESQYAREHVDQGIAKMIELGYDEAFAHKVGDYIEWMDKRSTVDLRTAPIEVQIVSSADACSHFASPFHYTYWYENSDKPISEIVAGKPARISTDWDDKMVLPEARRAFQQYHDVTKVQNGALPERFLPSI